MGYKTKRLSVGEAFAGYPVALRQHSGSEVAVWFCSNMVGIYDLSEEPPGYAAIRRKQEGDR